MRPTSSSPLPQPPLAAAAAAVAAAAALALGACSQKQGPCPKEMALVPGTRACIDRYEASLEGGEAGDREGKGTDGEGGSRAGAVPAVQVSQLQARAACANAASGCARGSSGWPRAGAGAQAQVRLWRGLCGRALRRPALAKKKGDGRSRRARCRTARPPRRLRSVGQRLEWLADTATEGDPADLMGGGFGNDGKSMACEQNERIGQPVTQQARPSASAAAGTPRPPRKSAARGSPDVTFWQRAWAGLPN
jgi:hypothetical protein